tara:strand:- start:431 stop:580 length:150 start_codon:yes stop_codon:yes gene_type:complete
MINPIKKFPKKPTHTFHPEYDDEFYINEIIGIDEITYEDWIGDRKEEKK